MNRTFRFLSFISLLVSVLGLMFSAHVRASELKEINIVSEAWENQTNKDGTGLYWDIIRLVYESVGIKVNFKTREYSRSVALVRSKRSDAWVGSYLNEEEGVLYPTSHFDADIVSALFVPKPDFKWEGEKSLAGKNVAWNKGYELHEYLDVKFKRKEFTSRKNVISLLKAGRIDFYIDAQVELISYFGDALSKNELRSEIIKRLNLYLAFSDSERGKALLRIFDERFKQLLVSGEIKTLFEKWNGHYIF